MRKLLFLCSHLIAVAVGFALGIYFLPILTAPEAPSVTEVAAVSEKSMYQATFRRDLEGSDFAHWGEGEVSISADAIALQGEIAPGPDYILYLAPEMVETEAAFERIKAKSVVVGQVKTFKNFLLPVSGAIDPSDHVAVVIWCESFGEFITAAQYQ